MGDVAVGHVRVGHSLVMGMMRVCVGAEVDPDI